MEGVRAVASGTSATDDVEKAIRDKCGVVGVVAPAGTEVAPLIAYALRALQHRGQESTGIVTQHEGKSVLHRNMGLVENVYTPEVLRTLQGPLGIGHVRYATTGGSTIENAQPLLVTSAGGDVALAHNGDIVNSKPLRDEFIAKGWSFLTTNDTEVALRMLAAELATTPNRVKALRNVMKRLSGSYCFTLLIGDTLYAVRDPLGIKPLCYGSLPGGGFMVASESTALNVVGGELIRDVEPGEILEVTLDGVKGFLPEKKAESAHCMFEYVYFARADSIMDGATVYDVRVDIGKRLAKEQPALADVVIPVPDSGRTHATGYAFASGIPFAEGLMKNRYVHRTFIMPDQKMRDQGVRMKLNPVKSVIQGKRVVLVDDSIVRGTTMRRIIQMVRDAGATEVHVRIGSPPITSPCYLGIDMNTRGQLVAAELTIPEICKMIGADSLGYISLEGLTESIGKSRSQLCTGCLTGEYPVAIPGEKQRGQATLF
ncbi:MAG TPA: amidophosphoribosyltransferase [Candidatus Thermoplasmatota archaeon]|nr:amidophosphoribosyltransferase [Candidatus Thermoplasmatota archaeon]